MLLGDRPREIVIAYDLGSLDARQLDVRILDAEGRTAAAGTFRGRVRHDHRPRLAPGTYRLEARVVLEDGTRRDLDRELVVGPDDERLVLFLDR